MSSQEESGISKGKKNYYIIMKGIFDRDPILLLIIIIVR